LSCGGRIALQHAANERVLVATLCGGSPPRDQALSPFAQYLHGAWALGDDPIAQRRTEDVAALAALGCDGLHLDQLDAPYRMPEYGEGDNWRGTPVPHDPLLPAAQAIMQQLWEQQPGAHFYVPLGVGNHVDHQLVCVAGWHLHDAGAKVVWYEDAPYAAKDPAAIDARLQVLADQFVPEIVEIGAVLERKLNAIRCYESQLGELFGNKPMEQVMTRYAQMVGAQRGLDERVWHRS
jgi:LmbE family N-acetylglucosaminyl deacetylase